MHITILLTLSIPRRIRDGQALTPQGEPPGSDKCTFVCSAPGLMWFTCMTAQKHMFLVFQIRLQSKPFLRNCSVSRQYQPTFLNICQILNAKIYSFKLAEFFIWGIISNLFCFKNQKVVNLYSFRNNDRIYPQVLRRPTRQMHSFQLLNKYSKADFFNPMNYNMS